MQFGAGKKQVLFLANFFERDLWKKSTFGEGKKPSRHLTQFSGAPLLKKLVSDKRSPSFSAIMIEIKTTTENREKVEHWNAC